MFGPEVTCEPGDGYIECCACERTVPRTSPEQTCMCEECEAKCYHCGQGDAYPWYGFAPHKDEKGNLPSNFFPDPEDPVLGTYEWCPVCKYPKE